MKKNLKSLFVFASIAISASIVVIACGDGTSDIIDDWFKQSILDGAEDKAVADIEHVVDSVTKAGGPSSSITPSSSSVPPSPGTSSSSAQPPSSASPGTSSSDAQPPSSASPGTSSSSVPTNPPSSSSVKSSAAPSQSASGCKENDPKSGFTCGWSISGTSTTPGKPLTHAAATLPSGCTAVEWKYFDDDDPMTAIYGCTKLPEGGFKTEGLKKYFLFAELTCGDKKQTTACNKTALSTQPAPYLKGNCEWEKNPTTKARGGTPKKTIAVVDSANPKICGSNPTIAYKYDSLPGKEATWPSSGILDSWKGLKGKDTVRYDITATLVCPNYSTPLTTKCPTLVVTGGADQLVECTGGWAAANCTAGTNKDNTAVLKLDECAEINVLGLTQEHQKGVKLVARCSMNNTAQSSSLKLKLNGTTKVDTTFSWSWNGVVNIGTTVLPNNEFGTLCVTGLTGATSLKCELGQ